MYTNLGGFVFFWGEGVDWSMMTEHRSWIVYTRDIIYVLEFNSSSE